jgi:hypothetical protein
MNSKVAGVGTDAPTVVNELGGKQSQVLYRFDLVDPQAMFKMTEVLKQGFDKYGGDENWRKISVREHLNHMLIHAYAYLAGDTSDEHLSHIMCRAMFAQAVDITDGHPGRSDGLDTDGDYDTEMLTYLGFNLRCGMCRTHMHIPGEGTHKCENCGTGHKTTVKDGEIYVDPADNINQSSFVKAKIDTIINCVRCRAVMYIPDNGIHKCENCGTDHSVAIKHGEALVYPVGTANSQSL